MIVINKSSLVFFWLEYGTVFGALISYTGRKRRTFEEKFFILTFVIHLSTNHTSFIKH